MDRNRTCRALCAGLPLVGMMLVQACYDHLAFDPKSHPCSACGACAVCVATSATQVRCMPRKARAKLACSSAGQRVWLDSCNDVNTVVEQCSAHAECIDDAPNGAEPSCKCRNHWQGAQCDSCPSNFAAEADCNRCASFYEGEDCDVCPGHFDAKRACSACRNHWGGNTCDECPGHWDAEQDCAVCRNRWQGAECSVCPAQWDPASDCSQCSAKFMGDECSVCTGHFTGPQCVTCPGHWDPSAGCGTCLPGYVDQHDDCGSCAQGLELASDGSCREFCGNGIATAGEACDDANSDGLDGCHQCRITAFRAHAATTASRGSPSVASAPDGAFVVVWVEMAGPTSVVGQKFAADGSAIGGKLAISQTDAQGALPRVAMADDGRFVVVWKNASGVVGRLFDAQARPVAGEFRIDHTGETPSGRVALSGSGDGSFDVAFSVGNSIVTRSFDASGLAASSFTAGVRNNDASPAIHDPAVAMPGVGGAPLVAYVQEIRYLGLNAAYEYSDNVMLNRNSVESYADIGGGSAFDQSAPSVAASRAGVFAAAWIDRQSSSYSVRARWLGSDVKNGPLLATPAGTADATPAIAVLGEDRLALAWMGGSALYWAVFDNQGAVVQQPRAALGAGNDSDPAVAGAPDAGVILVWDSNDQILCARFDAQGNPLPWPAPHF